MKAIILSAGQGSRLLPLTESVPKCCLMLDGKPLLQHQVESLAANGLDDIVIVTGFNHQKVGDIVNDINIPGVSVRTLYNPFYAVSDNLGTTWIARKEMRSPFLLVNGDTLSIILFGGLTIWALAEIVMINRAEPDYTPYEGGSLTGDIRLAVITIVIFGIIAGIHTWLGYSPFGG